jgi:hypothetical protein
MPILGATRQINACASVDPGVPRRGSREGDADGDDSHPVAWTRTVDASTAFLLDDSGTVVRGTSVGGFLMHIDEVRKVCIKAFTTPVW